MAERRTRSAAGRTSTTTWRQKTAACRPASRNWSLAMTDSDSAIRDASAVWVYALTERGGAALPGVTGVAGGPVRLVDADGLTAVVSSVSLEEFGEEALRRNLEDLAWLEAVARAAPWRHRRRSPAVHAGADAAGHRVFRRGDHDGGRDRARRAVPLRAGAGSVAHRVGREGVRDASEAGRGIQQAGAAAPAGQAEEVDSGLAYLRRRRDALSASRDSAHGPPTARGRCTPSLSSRPWTAACTPRSRPS